MLLGSVSLKEERGNQNSERLPIHVRVLDESLILHLIMLLDESVRVQFSQVNDHFTVIQILNLFLSRRGCMAGVNYFDFQMIVP